MSAARYRGDELEEYEGFSGKFLQPDDYLCADCDGR
jgi:hypothetical protein